MKRIMIALATSVIMIMSAMADTTIGVSMAFFDDLFLTNVREAMAARAKELGVKIQFEDAQGDIGRQLSQIQNFTAQKVGCDHREPGRLLSHPADDKARHRRRRSSGLRQPPA
jgi:ABC-type sugar transport system substrate-binding protein